MGGESIGVKVLLVGGTVVPVRDQINRLIEGAHVVVGTPGRIHDFMEKGFLKSDYLKILVLDEADEIFSRGFEQKINDIFKYIPNQIQIALFSPTIPNDILKFANNFMRDPAKIIVKNESTL